MTINLAWRSKHDVVNMGMMLTWIYSELTPTSGHGYTQTAKLFRVSIAFALIRVKLYDFPKNRGNYQS